MARRLRALSIPGLKGRRQTHHAAQVGQAVRATAPAPACRPCPGPRFSVPVMTVPALPWLWSRHDETHHHYRRYTRAGLEAALVLAGLKPVKISYFNTLLFPLIAAVRLVKRLLGHEGAGDDAMPSPAVNEILKRIFGLESRLVGRIPLPLGVSLVAVAERPL